MVSYTLAQRLDSKHLAWFSTLRKFGESPSTSYKLKTRRNIENRRSKVRIIIILTNLSLDS